MSSSPENAQKINVIKPSLPKGGGDLKGMGETFAPHEFSGSAGLSIPIPATSCRDFTPGLSLNYSSGSGNGPFGMGMELSLSSISRQTSKCVPKYDETDTFLLTGDDYLVPKLDTSGKPISGTEIINTLTYTSKTFVPRTAGSFSIIQQITRQTDSKDVFWVVKHADNSTSIYGKSCTARIYDPADESKIFKWLLEETFNDKGDHQLYTYWTPKKDIENRENGAQRYLSTIQYGITTPWEGSILLFPIDLMPSWRFQIAFDYGEYTLPKENKAWSKTGTPTWRADAFSDYRSGFEIRTGYRCKSVLLFHQFPEKEYGTAEPVLVNALDFTYDSSKPSTASAVRSLLNTIQHTGYTYNSFFYTSKSLPALNLKYSLFEPTQTGCFEEILNQDGKPLVGLTRSPEYQLVDLFGGGIPGILYEDGTTVRYASAKSIEKNTVQYNVAEDISFPNLQAPVQLKDVQGNGHLDVFSAQPHLEGYFETGLNTKLETNIQAWKAFDAFPSDYLNSANAQVDVTGNGLADTVMIAEDTVRVYPALGTTGYGAAYAVVREAEVPCTTPQDGQTLLTFTNLCGLGLSQRVEIRNGSVRCWPNLGYGKFGTAIALKNAPKFSAAFDINRVRLADVDGSGLTDFVYIYPDHIKVYLNESGNGFSTIPIVIPFPEKYDNLDEVLFEDIRGVGSVCLVYTTAHPTPKQWFYDFNRSQRHDITTGELSPRSVKPYLLIGTDNNKGASTVIQYASSTQFYLEDQKNGLDWITRLPFPVQVIEATAHIDHISNTKTVASYAYHHGYYDGTEREFRGFGQVDRTDAATFEHFQPADDAAIAAYKSPPVLTKTWYHTGNVAEQSAYKAYQKNFWNGDPQAYELPETVFTFLENPITPITGTTTPSAKQEAHRLLHGTVIRSEVYGNDDSPWQADPYSVSESHFEVNQLQKKGENKYGVYQLIHRESMSYAYERNALDPKVTQNLTLAVDEYGQVKKSVEITYGRRHEAALETATVMAKQTKVQQKQLHVSWHETEWINQPGTTVFTPHLLGISKEERSTVITNVKPANKPLYFTLKEAKAFAKPTNWLSWHRNYYYDVNTHKECPLGTVSIPVLHHRTEFIELENASLNAGLFGVSTPETTAKILAEGGYLRFPTDEAIVPNLGDYFWNPGSFQSYGGVDSFYLPTEFFDALQYHHLVAKKEIKGTKYAYDDYYMMPVSVIDALGNTATITKIDYQHLAPVQMLDINHNTSEVLLDELGMVIASSFYGEENGTTIGFAPLSDYVPMPVTSLDDVFANPATYLQNAAHFFYYDLDACQTSKTPVHFANLVAENYPIDTWTSDKTPNHFANLEIEDFPIDTNPAIQMSVAYSDGSGRELQSKVFADYKQTVRTWNAQENQVEEVPAASCWITSGAVRYNDKGQAIEQFEPFFSPTFNYIDQAGLNQVGFSSTLYYDALGRNVLTVNPKGYQEKHLFGHCGTGTKQSYKGYLNKQLYGALLNNFIPSPWVSLAFDANDTDSTTNCFNTPHIAYIDSLGHAVEQGQVYVDSNEQNSTFSLYDDVGRLIEKADQRQLAKPAITPTYFERLQFTAGQSSNLFTAFRKPIKGSSQSIIDSSGHLTSAFKPNTDTFQTQLTAFLLTLGTNFADKKALILSSLEAIGTNFSMTYSLGAPLKTISADAGTTWGLTNVLGQPIWSFDSRGTVQKPSYDILNRPIAIEVKNDGKWDATLSLNQTVQKTVYGDSVFPAVSGVSGETPIFKDSFAKNLRGKPVIIFDQSGLSLHPLNNIQGESLIDGLVLAEDYTKDVNWKSIEKHQIIAITNSISKISSSSLRKLNPAVWKIKQLEDNIFVTHAQHDALGRTSNAFDPDGNEVANAYYRTGQPKAVSSKPGHLAKTAGIKIKATATPGITRIQYNAKGQETITEEANGVITTKSYDPKDFRLIGIKSTRKSDSTVLQNLIYTYDPVGNVKTKEDVSVAPAFYRNAKIEPKAVYTYDSLYRLSVATGREHTGMWKNVQTNENQIQGIPQLASINDATALRNYTQKFGYDSSGNVLLANHTNTSSRNLSIDAHSNRLFKSQFPNKHAQATAYAFDLHGNQLDVSGGKKAFWNYRNNTRSVELIVPTASTSDYEYYQYNAGGHRTRKVKEKKTGQTAATQITEAIYLGGFEIRRKGTKSSSGLVAYKEEWHWNNVAGCRWGYQTAGTVKPGSKPYQLRYQLTDILESSCMEVDATGKIITHEEYYPYGGTSLIAASSETEVKQRHYRYSGKEADCTGLYYYGMRYYCPWLMRWTCPDPAGTIDGLNIYAFVNGNPVTHLDVGGMACGNCGEPRHNVRRCPLKVGLEKKGSKRKREVEEVDERQVKRKKTESISTTRVPLKSENAPSESKAEIKTEDIIGFTFGGLYPSPYFNNGRITLIHKYKSNIGFGANSADKCFFGNVVEKLSGAFDLQKGFLQQAREDRSKAFHDIHKYHSQGEKHEKKIAEEKYHRSISLENNQKQKLEDLILRSDPRDEAGRIQLRELFDKQHEGFSHHPSRSYYLKASNNDIKSHLMKVLTGFDFSTVVHLQEKDGAGKPEGEYMFKLKAEESSEFQASMTFLRDHYSKRPTSGRSSIPS